MSNDGCNALQQGLAYACPLAALRLGPTSTSGTCGGTKILQVMAQLRASRVSERRRDARERANMCLHSQTSADSPDVDV